MMAFLYDVPEYKKIRVIVDTDAACEADDPFAIVHALLSPKLIVRGITAEHFGVSGSMEKSYQEILTILDHMNMRDIPAFRGQEEALKPGEVQEESEAVRFLIDEALREDEKPLYVLCQGAITNVAVAIQICPEIVNRMTIIWIGTHGESPCKAHFREFNAGNDILAANRVLRSKVDLWLVPSQVYGTVTIGIAEIKRRISVCGKIGRHLYDNLMTYNNSGEAGWTQGESWSLGDSPAIAIALNPGCGHYKTISAPEIASDTSSVDAANAREIRVYTDVDSRYILEDLIAKLELFCSEEE